MPDSNATETVTGVYTVCDDCDAHYEASPTNHVSVGQFSFCPNCGTELADDNPRKIEHELGWIPDVP